VPAVPPATRDRDASLSLVIHGPSSASLDCDTAAAGPLRRRGDSEGIRRMPMRATGARYRTRWLFLFQKAILTLYMIFMGFFPRESGGCSAFSFLPMHAPAASSRALSHQTEVGVSDRM
jgi:hypothetical protein